MVYFRTPARSHETQNIMIDYSPASRIQTTAIEDLFTVRNSDGTTSGFDQVFYPISYELSLLENISDTINQTADRKVAAQARNLLNVFQEIFVESSVDLTHLPPLHSTIVNDGSILIEWIFKDFRIGFSIEPNPDESGWYLVSNKNQGGISASGYISSAHLKKMLLWLTSFVLIDA